MNHGILATEFGSRPGRAVWDWNEQTGCGLAVYSSPMMQWGSGALPAHPWHESFDHLIDEVKVLPKQEYCEPYARYSPIDSLGFSKMIVRCQGYSGSPTLIVPGSTDDDQAKRDLETFYSILPRLSLREMRYRALARIVQRISIEADWAYYVGFASEMPPTYFISERPEVIDAFGSHCLKFVSEYQIQERW